jgi:phosphoglycolate phosphatase
MVAGSVVSESATGVPVLVLWDVDHTLSESRGVGRELYHTTFTVVTGRPVEHEVEVTGRTEQAIFMETARRHGIEPSTDLAERYREELARQYEAHLDEVRRRGRALPHAKEVLADLAAQGDVVQTVLTGNYRRVAELKLGAFGLAQYVDFDGGAYGEDAVERADLLPLARARAGALRSSGPAPADRTVVIGDSVSDVKPAQGQALAIAVATEDLSGTAACGRRVSSPRRSCRRRPSDQSGGLELSEGWSCERRIARDPDLPGRRAGATS